MGGRRVQGTCLGAFRRRVYTTTSWFRALGDLFKDTRGQSIYVHLIWSVPAICRRGWKMVRFVGQEYAQFIMNWAYSRPTKHSIFRPRRQMAGGVGVGRGGG